MTREDARSAMESRLSEGLWLHKPAKPADQLNPIVLAYIGDAVYELLVRQYLISLPNHKLHHLHRQATLKVSAKAQCQLLRQLMPELTEEEADVVRRGRNAKSGAPPKNADMQEYRQATAFECLIGYLYYQQQAERLQHIIGMLLDVNGSVGSENKEDME